MDAFKSFVSIDTDIVLQWMNTLIMFLVLKKILFKPVTEFMASRTNEIEGSFKEADEAVRSANSMKAEYESRLGQAKLEANDIVKEASRRADSRAEEILEAAKKEAARIKEKAEMDIVREKQKAMNEVKNEISAIALMAASKVIEIDLDGKKHESLINDFIDNVGEARWQN